MSTPSWISKVNAQQELDSRKQPWKDFYGEEVADRNPRAYSTKENDVDLFENGAFTAHNVSVEASSNKQGKCKDIGGIDDNDCRVCGGSSICTICGGNEGSSCSSCDGSGQCSACATFGGTFAG